jgi:hypothetical protein
VIRAPRLDAGGALLAMAGLTAGVFSIIEAPEAGWVTARTIGGIAGGAGPAGGLRRLGTASAAPDGIHAGLLCAAGAALLAAVTVAVLLSAGLRARPAARRDQPELAPAAR